MNFVLKKKLNKFALAIWNSSTMTSWASYIVRAGGLIIIMPMTLSKFSVNEVALWYLFLSIIGLQNLADFGFRNTFTRAIAYGMGGVKELTIVYRDGIKKETIGNDAINWFLIEKIVSTAKTVYFRLSVLLFALLGTLGTLSIQSTLSSSEKYSSGLIAWFVIVLTTSISFYGNVFIVYIEGLNKIPLLKRWETLTYFGSFISSFIVLMTYGTLLSLVIVNQLWVLFAVLRNKSLSLYVFDQQFKVFKKSGVDKDVFKFIWPACWRSGLAGVLNIGLVNFSGIAYAQIGNTSAVASYLMSLKLITQIRSLSMAPFYSKLPLFSRLRSEGKIDELEKKAKKGMKIAHFVFVIASIALGLSADYLLENLLKSETQFVSPLMWCVLAIAFYIHRFGAMHIQLYSTSNHIISHIADGYSGLIFIVFSFVLFNILGVFAFPVSMIIAYLGFYSWFAAKHSYRSLDTSFFQFEKNASIMPLVIMLLYLFFTVGLYVENLV